MVVVPRDGAVVGGVRVDANLLVGELERTAFRLVHERKDGDQLTNFFAPLSRNQTDRFHLKCFRI